VACCQFGHLKTVSPKPKLDDCNIADVLFISQIYNVKLEQKYNRITSVEITNDQPKLQQTFCCMA
jgi:hypothetical protein